MATWSSNALSRGSLYTSHHLPRSAPSLGCASFQPAGSASLNPTGAGAPGRWYLGPTMQAIAKSSNPAVPRTIDGRKRLERAVPSFITESLNRIHVRRLAGRVVAKEHPHHRGKYERQEDRQRADLRGPIRKVRDQQRSRQPNDDSDNSTQQGERHGFHQELQQDVARLGAHRLPQADLARSFGHR